MLITELKRHFPARMPEWANAITLFAWGAYTLLHPGIFMQPYLQELAAVGAQWSESPERFWGLICVVVGMARACALFINGSYHRTPMVRLFASAVSAFVWAQIVIGIWRTGIPAHGLVMYSSALALDMISAYRSGVDVAISEASHRAGMGAVNVSSLPTLAKSALSEAPSLIANISMLAVFGSIVAAGIMRGVKEFRDFVKPAATTASPTAQIAAATILENVTLNEWSRSNKEVVVAIGRLCDMLAKHHDEMADSRRVLEDVKHRLGTDEVAAEIADALANYARSISPDHKIGTTAVASINTLAQLLFNRGVTPTNVVPIKPRMMLLNPDRFFELAKDVLGPLSQGEVDGCNAILKACGDAGYSIGDVSYALATAYHETAGTMLPVKEYGGPSYFFRMYDIGGARPAKARELGNLSPGDGAKYCGRGYPQLTGKINYAKATLKLLERGLLLPHESLVDHPDLAMRPDIAAAIMVYGMSEGWFTGRDLDDDIPRDGPATYDQFFKSRDIINGTDKQAKIAQEAVEFQQGVVAGGWAMAA